MKMKIEIRNDTAVVSGYVNAVGRDSRPITDVRGKFVEQIEPGAFRASLERSENVDLLLNHDKSKVYASTKDGSLKLTEDSIGLRAEAVLTDAEMIRKARSGEFRGWSFGMYVGDSDMEERAEGIPRRHVKSLNMFEVSLIDRSKIPCYVGTSVECRAEGEDVLAELRYSEEEPEIIEEERSEPEPADYSAVDDAISELRYGAVDNAIAELRYNPYHDPSNGRFTSGGGGGGGVLVVEKGQKGKGYYVVPSEYFEKNQTDSFGIDTDSLPALEGTPKQVAWAEDIRRNYIEGLNEYYKANRDEDFYNNMTSVGQPEVIRRNLITVFPEGVPDSIYSEFTLPTQEKNKIMNKYSRNEEIFIKKYDKWRGEGQVLSNRQSLELDKAKAKQIVKAMDKLSPQINDRIKSQTSAKWWIEHR